MGEGRKLGIPTLNLELSQVPPELKEGIYACFVTISGRRLMGAMHYGPRPVFDTTTTCEVHLLDETLTETPEAIEVEVRGFIRPVADFPSKEDLVTQIQDDIRAARSILST